MTLENLKYKWSFLGASVDTEIIRKIDELRGDVPRSRIVQRALRQFLEREVTNAQGERRDEK